MIRNTVCVEVTCDDCRQPLGGDEGPVHYANFDDARKWNEDWVIRDDGHATCGDCGDRDTCSREGHQWQPWVECNCGGTITAHTDRCTARFRVCDRCVKLEYRTAPNVDAKVRAVAQ